MMKLHAGHIELALANYFNFQTHLIVPNVSYGWGLNYEADLVIITPSRYAWEIEIKTSIADLKADLKKKHQHDSNKFKALYFAVPRDLKEKALELIPERAGLFVILEPRKENKWFPAVMLIKSPKINMKADKITDKELEKLYKLAAMRIWSLKEIIYKLQKE
ncbi:MAG: MmcB family DNA repair protein [Patescibacteria group bacterium]